MRVKMKTHMAGPSGTATAGAIVDVDDAVAKAWLKEGFAEPVRSRPKEKAVAPEGETTQS